MQKFSVGGTMGSYLFGGNCVGHCSTVSYSWHDMHRYHLKTLANRTTYVDNFIGNKTQIARVRFTFDSWPRLSPHRLSEVVCIFRSVRSFARPNTKQRPCFTISRFLDFEFVTLRSTELLSNCYAGGLRHGCIWWCS